MSNPVQPIPSELDSKKLGRLKRETDPRYVWKSEAGDFTPWLAENIGVLSDALGMVLTVTGTEVPVGGLSSGHPGGRR